MTEPQPSQRERAEWFRHAGLSIRDIANLLGLPRATVGGWLRGVERGAWGDVVECAWCGDSFVAKNPRRIYCCRAHTVAAAHQAARERQHA